MGGRLRHFALVFALVAGVGCGGDEESSPVARTQPPVGAPVATVTASPSPAPTASATPTPVEEQEGGAGDEEAARIPVEVTLDGEGLTPPTVSVPAYFALEIVVHNDLDRDAVVRLGDVAFRAPAGERAQGRHPGLSKGEHALRAGGSRATIVAGAEPGP